MESVSQEREQHRHSGYAKIAPGDLGNVDFLASKGWHLKSDPTTFDLKGEVVRNDDFVVGRYSHGPAVFEHIVPDDLANSDRVMLLACLDGAVTLHSATGTAHLEPLTVALIQPDEFTGVECEASATCMFVIYRAVDADKHHQILTGQSNEVYLHVLEAATFSLLQSPPDELRPGFVQIQRGLEEMAKAIAISSGLHPEAEDDPLSKLYEQATALISSMATDSEASVESVAHHLRVSRSYLFKAFKAHGSTPSLEIKRARLHTAQRLLEDGASLPDAAASSGFRSVRNLKRALHGDDEHM